MKPIIGIVSCGYMENRQFVSQAYIQAIEDFGGIPILLPCTPDKMIYPYYLKICDGFLFCGGDDVTPLLFGEELIAQRGVTDLLTDRFHISLMKHILSCRSPILAVCRGMQILNISLGGTIFQDISLRQAISLNHMQLSEKRSDPCHKIMVSNNSILSNILSKYEAVNSFHHQCIKRLGKNLKISAIASDGIVEAIESNKHPFALGVQWHPECMATSSVSMRRLFQIFIEKSKNTKKQQYISLKSRTH